MKKKLIAPSLFAFLLMNVAQASVTVNPKDRYAFDLDGVEAQTFFQVISKYALGATPSSQIQFGAFRCNEIGFDFQQPGCSMDVGPTTIAQIKGADFKTIFPVYDQASTAYFATHGEASVMGVTHGECSTSVESGQPAFHCTLIFQPNGSAA